MPRSDRIYLGLVLSWLFIDLGFFLAPPETIPEGQQVNASRLLLDVALAMVGFLALKAAERSGFEKLWSPHLSVKKRFLAPVVTGFILGFVPAAIDFVAPIGDIHADFPIALLNYYVGGLFSEVMFRLIPLGLLVWLVANKVLGKRWQTAVFWVVALTVGLYEPLVSWQIMTDPNVPGGFESARAAFGFVLTAYVLNVWAAYFFWTRGFLAAVVLRWAFYLVWHIVWPALHY